MNNQLSNHKLKFELWKLFFITVIVLFPFPIFIIILYTEPVVKDFFSINQSQINKIPHMQYEAPNLFNYFWFSFSLWFAVTAIIISIIFLIVFTYKFNIRYYKKNYSPIIILLSILLILILSIILLSLSEIKYYYINQWCDTIKKYYSSSPPDPLLAPYEAIIGEILKNINEHDDSMHWLNYNNALWVSGVEISILCFVFINFQLKLFSNNKDAQLIHEINKNYKRESFGESKEKQFLSRILKPTPKNVSIFIIFISFIVLLPCFYYLLKISFFSNSFNVLIRLTFYQPTMPKIENPLDDAQYYDFFNSVILKSKFHNYYNILLVLYVPEILLILSLSFTIIFIYFIINENSISINFLISLISILCFFIFITCLSIFISSYILNGISNTWTKEVPKFPLFQHFLSYEYGVWNNGSIEKFWFNINESISLLILQLSLFSSITLIGISQTYKTKLSKKNISKIIPV